MCWTHISMKKKRVRRIQSRWCTKPILFQNSHRILQHTRYLGLKYQPIGSAWYSQIATRDNRTLNRCQMTICVFTQLTLQTDCRVHSELKQWIRSNCFLLVDIVYYIAPRQERCFAEYLSRFIHVIQISFSSTRFHFCCLQKCVLAIPVYRTNKHRPLDTTLILNNNTIQGQPAFENSATKHFYGGLASNCQNVVLMKY